MCRSPASTRRGPLSQKGDDTLEAVQHTFLGTRAEGLPALSARYRQFPSDAVGFCRSQRPSRHHGAQAIIERPPGTHSSPPTTRVHSSTTYQSFISHLSDALPSGQGASQLVQALPGTAHPVCGARCGGPHATKGRRRSNASEGCGRAHPFGTAPPVRSLSQAPQDPSSCGKSSWLRPPPRGRPTGQARPGPPQAATAGSTGEACPPPPRTLPRHPDGPRSALSLSLLMIKDSLPCGSPLTPVSCF